MKISTKATYGIRFMLQLAVSYSDTYVKAIDVAKAEGISDKYLENIISTLKPSGLIEVKRGSNGGYKLSRPPSTINLYELFYTLEGSVLAPDNQSNKTANEKVVNRLWSDLSGSIKFFLENKSLEDLVTEHNKKSGNQMYYI